jgi:hypothetical protein
VLKFHEVEGASGLGNPVQEGILAASTLAGRGDIRGGLPYNPQAILRPY